MPSMPSLLIHEKRAQVKCLRSRMRADLPVFTNRDTAQAVLAKLGRLKPQRLAVPPANSKNEYCDFRV
jgi:hypothetical protein